jgi:hypothetical protein
LGKPSPDPQVQSQLKQQARDDEKVRVEIEGKFGQGKRRFSLARVMAKLAETAETAIAMTFLVMNLERRLRRLLFSFFVVCSGTIVVFYITFVHLIMNHFGTCRI